ncbi:MAG: M56 family metallopeptidase [Firmicutes bacterium]|nr:M56 family metallopeptidase [Bacillota bacterium]
MSILINSLILPVFDRILFISMITIPLIIVIIILRFCLRKHPRKWSYRLWFLLWISILISFTSAVPDSLAFIADSALTQEAYINTESINKNTGGNIDDLPPAKDPSAVEEQDTRPPYYKSNIEESETVSSKKDIMTASEKFQTVRYEVRHYLYDIKQQLGGAYYAAAIFWTAVTLLIFSLLIRSYLKIYVRIRTAVKIYDNVFESENVSSPFVWGIFRQKILLPNGLTQNDIKYVTLHEKAHVDHFDNAVLLLSWIVSAIFWFNPLIWLCVSLFRSDMEIRCDEYAAAGLNRNGKLEYLSVLIRFAEGKTIRKPLASMSGKSFFKERINSVMKEPNKNKIAIIVTVIICLFTSVICISFAADYNNEKVSDSAAEDININNNVDAVDPEFQFQLDMITRQLSNEGHNVDAVILNDSGEILAQEGDITKKIMPHSAMRPAAAACVLADPKTDLNASVPASRFIYSDYEHQIANWLFHYYTTDTIPLKTALREICRPGLAYAFLNTDDEYISAVLKNTGLSTDFLNGDSEEIIKDKKVELAVGYVEMDILQLANLYRSIFGSDSALSEDKRQMLKDIFSDSLNWYYDEYISDFCTPEFAEKFCYEKGSFSGGVPIAGSLGIYDSMYVDDKPIEFCSVFAAQTQLMDEQVYIVITESSRIDLDIQPCGNLIGALINKLVNGKLPVMLMYLPSSEKTDLHTSTLAAV